MITPRDVAWSHRWLRIPGLRCRAICIFWIVGSVVSQGQAQDPPFSGTAFLHTDIITEADVTTLVTTTYMGQDWRWVFDRRVNDWVYQPMHLFATDFSDGLTSEIQVNPVDFPDQGAAAIEADRYGRSVGRLPTSLRLDVESVTIHKGMHPFGGGNNNILIHTDQAVSYGEYLEEILFHEATHTSYDADHASSSGWLNAQQNDPTFISTYAQDFPMREDVAESLLPWFALRHTDVLFPFQIDAITASIPNRLAYFDSLPFQSNPGIVGGDFNSDGLWNCDDINALTNAVAISSSDLTFDMNGDAMLTLEDVTDPTDGWLAVGGAHNPSDTGGNAFLIGDVTLDGTVDGLDFIVWNANKFTDNTHWCDGDLNADATIDGLDFILWNAFKFTSSDSVSAVPEPGSCGWISLAVIVAFGIWRN